MIRTSSSREIFITGISGQRFGGLKVEPVSVYWLNKMSWLLVGLSV